MLKLVRPPFDKIPRNSSGVASATGALSEAGGRNGELLASPAFDCAQAAALAASDSMIQSGDFMAGTVTTLTRGVK